MEEDKADAKQAYGTLIKMGGRPTHPLRSQPIWKTILINGFLYWRDEELKVDRCELEQNYIGSHWSRERTRFQEELRQWQRFRDFQQRVHDDQQDRGVNDNPNLQQQVEDQHLAACLTRLKDWREYRVYQQEKIESRQKWFGWCRRAVEAIEQRTSEVDLDKLTFKGLSQLDLLHKMDNQLERLEPEEKRLKWIKLQFPLILSECAHSLIEKPTSCHHMKERIEADTRQVYASLISMGGRPTRPIRPVPGVEEGDQADFLFVLFHWEGEYSQFEDQLTEWKQFQKNLLKKEFYGNNESPLQHLKSTESSVWKEYQAYQKMKVDNAKKWVEFWQRQARWFRQREKEYWAQPHMAEMVRRHYEEYPMINVLNSNLLGGIAQRYRSQAEEARSHAEDAQQQIRPAEMRLEWAEQQGREIISEQSVSSPQTPTSDQLQAQVKSQRAASKSDQSTSRNLGFKGADQSIVRSHRGLSSENTANSALSSVHSSKVSKVCKKEKPRHWPQSRIFAKRINCQEQGPYSTISPISSTSVMPRRSSRLAYCKQNSNALQSELRVNPNTTVQSWSIKTAPRRSERISQQEEKISGSILNSIMESQTDSFKRVTRPKPKRLVASNESGMKLAKPSGVSKRQWKE